MGLSEGLRHSLESYLKKSAAELDERGAEITFRENEVEYELKRLETLENELLRRAARIEELRPQQERADEALRRALGTVARTRAGESDRADLGDTHRHRPSGRHGAHRRRRAHADAGAD